MRSDSLLRGGDQAASGGRREWARPCDSCAAAASAVYCRADAAYLCAGCDARVHSVNSVASRHERVWVCQACERAPAALTCRADAAALCAACDADVHTANPLSRRHHRDPILPLPPGRLPRSAGQEEEEDAADEEEAASWLLLNPVGTGSTNKKAAGFLYGGEVEEYLDLVEYNSGTENRSHDHHHHYPKVEETEQLVPMECMVPNDHQNQQHQHQQQHQNFSMGMDYEVSNSGFSYSASLSHNVSLSSMEAGVVPETPAMTDISSSHIRASKATIDLFSVPPVQIPPQFTPMDREARVLRYREKRKMRKFEKTIRYASRKAYAETRPRIKGRFAKRSDVELEVDQMFATSMMSEGSYGIVPSF